MTSSRQSRSRVDTDLLLPDESCDLWPESQFQTSTLDQGRFVYDDGPGRTLEYDVSVGRKVSDRMTNLSTVHSVLHHSVSRYDERSINHFSDLCR